MDSKQQRLQNALQEMKSAQRDLQKKMETRQQLDAQLSENKIVKEELDLIKSDDTKIYKLIGPALVKQDHGEAKATVAKRIEYITAELKRYETIIKDLEGKQTEAQTKIAQMKQEFDQQAKQAAAVQSAA